MNTSTLAVAGTANAAREEPPELFSEQELERFISLQEDSRCKYVEHFCKFLLTEAPPSTHPLDDGTLDPDREPSECLNPDCFDDSEDYNKVLFGPRYTHIHQEVHANECPMLHTPAQGQMRAVELPYCTICSLKYFDVEIAPGQDHIYSSITNANNRPLINIDRLPTVQLALRDSKELPTLRLYRQPKDFVRFMSRAYAFWRGVDHWRSNDWCNVLEACHRSAYEACLTDTDATPFLPN